MLKMWNTQHSQRATKGPSLSFPTRSVRHQSTLTIMSRGKCLQSFFDGGKTLNDSTQSFHAVAFPPASKIILNYTLKFSTMMVTCFRHCARNFWRQQTMRVKIYDTHFSCVSKGKLGELFPNFIFLALTRGEHVSEETINDSWICIIEQYLKHVNIFLIFFSSAWTNFIPIHIFICFFYDVLLYGEGNFHCRKSLLSAHRFSSSLFFSVGWKFFTITFRFIHTHTKAATGRFGETKKMKIIK